MKRTHQVARDSPLAPTQAAPGSHSGIAAAARVDESLAALPVHPLSELDVPMTMRVLRFEVELESRNALDDPRLGVARAMRLLLTRASAYALGEPSREGSFEASLAHALRRFYGWAFRALDAAILEQPVRAPSRAVESLLEDITAACAARGACDPLLARLRVTIDDLVETGRRFPTGRARRGALGVR